jgi:hypothetical protein
VNIISILRAFVVAATVLGFVSCANVKNPLFVFEDGKLISHLDDAEIADGQKTLEGITDSDVPVNMTGGIVIDCHSPSKLLLDRYGQQVFSVMPDHVYLGGDQLGGGVIKLVSPTIENGGVDLLPTDRYRIFAVKLDGGSDLFYIWRGTVLPLATANERHLGGTKRRATGGA